MKSWLLNTASPKYLALAALLLGSASLEAKTIYVNEKVIGGSNNGTSWANAFKYLQDALAVAGEKDNIFLAKGSYYPDQGAGRNFGFRDEVFNFAKAGLKVYGGFAGTETNPSQRNLAANPTSLSGKIWDGTNEEIYWSLHVGLVTEDTTFDGLTVEGGNANGYMSWVYPGEPFYNSGGGLYVSNSSNLTLKNCTVTNNAALESGGGIMLEGGTGSVVATNCTFSQNKITTFHLENSSGKGGAIYGGVTATDCTFLQNTVTATPVDGQANSDASGGAIFGTVKLTGCTFTSNTVAASSTVVGGASTSQGGAVNGVVVATKCNFISNGSTANAPTSRSYGGALSGTSVNAVNCGFATNTAGPGEITGISPNFTYNGGGGGVFVGDGTSAITNCVFSTNTSQFLGGGIAMKDLSRAGTLTVSNSTFLDNGVSSTGQGGAALSLQGITYILNNVFWNQTATSGTFNLSNLIDVKTVGVLRNTLGHYPVPVNFALNLVAGGLPSVTEKPGGDRYLGDTVKTLITASPNFELITDPDGPDGKFGTIDDGLKLKTGSPAIRNAATESNRDNTLPYQEFIAKDVQDMDEDSNLAENIPADLGGFVRVQDGFIDIGAYEFGPLLHVGDILVVDPENNNLPSGTSTFDFGSVSGLGQKKTFTIKNTGVANLTGVAITVSGANQADFKVTQALLTKVPAGGATTFDITFTPKADGLRTITVSIASSDPDENPYTFNVKGDGLTADIAVEQPAGSNLVDGTAVVNFGQSSINSTLARTFTVRNTGTGHLGITAINVAGANASDFKAFLPASKLVAPGASTTFRVEFTPSGVGTRNALVSILSNDPDAESSFDINLTGSGTDAPEIKVAQPTSSEIATGGSRSYGSVKRGLTYTKTFTISNVGVKPLKNIAASISGDADFSIEKPTADQLNAGENVKFKVSFKPTSTGAKSAVVKIKSNDSDENPFVINVSGTGISASAAARIALSSIVGESTSLLGTDGGKVTVRTGADGLSYLVLTVRKPANWALTNHRVEVSGNLVDWYSGRKYTRVLVDDDSILRVQDRTPVSKEHKRYIRLK